MTLQSWQNLDKIAKAPGLAEQVKTVQIATTNHLPHYASFEAWYQQHKDLFESDWQFTVSYPMGGPFSNLSRLPKAYFARYQQWRSGEKTMINHWRNGTAPTLQLNLLKKVQMVETIGHDELDVIKREYNRRVSYDGRLVGSHRSYRNVTRREVETLILDELKYGNDINATHLETFLRAVDISGATIPKLWLRSSKELLRLGSKFDIARLQLHSLRRLDIYLGIYEWSEPYNNRSAYPISPWIRTLTGLEELDIFQRASGQEIDIFRIIGETNFPKLSSVRLTGTSITYSNIVAFAERHQNSLRSFWMIEPRVSPEDWSAFFAGDEHGSWKAHGESIAMDEAE